MVDHDHCLSVWTAGLVGGSPASQHRERLARVLKLHVSKDQGKITGYKPMPYNLFSSVGQTLYFSQSSHSGVPRDWGHWIWLPWLHRSVWPQCWQLDCRSKAAETNVGIESCLHWESSFNIRWGIFYFLYKYDIMIFSGGYDGNSLDTILQYNIAGDEFTEVDTMLEERYHHAISVVSFSDFSMWCQWPVGK